MNRAACGAAWHAAAVSFLVGPAGAQLVAHELASESMPPAPPAPLLLAPIPLVAQGPFVSVQVNTDPTTGLDVLGDAGNEPSIARSLTDPDALIIGWRQFDSIASSYRKAGYAYSHDGGVTWSGRRVLDEKRQGSDPLLVAGPDGEFYYNTYRYAELPDHTEVWSSVDGGVTWEGGFNAHGGDKAWMAIDATDGPNRGALYQFWTSSCNVSFDGGRTWSPSTPGTPRWGQLAVGPDGRAYMSGQSVRLLVADAGAPGAAPTIVRLSGLPFKAPRPIDVSANLVNPSGIEGQTNIAVSAAPDQRRGEVYALQSSTGPDGGTQATGTEIYFAYSVDGGDNFGEATRVNDDPFNTAWHWFGAMGVAPNGRIDAVWNDTRDDPAPLSPHTSRLYASYSTDGGRTWAPNFPVSPSFMQGVGYPSQAKLGDYYTVVSDDLGAHVAWAATFTGGQDVYCLRLGTTDCDNNGVPDEMEIAAGLAGDVNRDWILDSCQCLADLTGDGALNLDDIDAFATAFIGGNPIADIVADGVLNLEDIAVFAASFVAGCP